MHLLKKQLLPGPKTHKAHRFFFFLKASLINKKRVARTFDRLNSDVSFLGAPVGCTQNTQDFLTGKDISAFKMRIELKFQFR